MIGVDKLGKKAILFEKRIIKDLLKFVKKNQGGGTLKAQISKTRHQNVNIFLKLTF